jgi:hypothetical protein
MWLVRSHTQCIAKTSMLHKTWSLSALYITHHLQTHIKSMGSGVSKSNKCIGAMHIVALADISHIYPKNVSYEMPHFWCVIKLSASLKYIQVLQETWIPYAFYKINHTALHIT